jgi:hypothetical protein
VPARRITRRAGRAGWNGVETYRIEVKFQSQVVE